MPRNQFALTIAALFALLVLFGIVGRMDADDAELQEEVYCDMVFKGHWSDYERKYHENCKNGQLVRR